MMESSGGFSVRAILRTILAVALLLGGGLGDWTPVQAQAAHESCCCGMPAGAEDACPCPKPEGNRTPTSNPSSNPTITVAAQAARRTQGERRTEPRPEPATWAQALDIRELSELSITERGRDPDLGRHLARLNTFRI
jgi:hypothetical protein